MGIPKTPALLALLLGLTALVYWPGLRGAFLFDDWSNLPLIGMFGPIDDLQTLIIYLLSGFSGPTGRPLSHLSFLIDARDWPASPEAFKRTNLLIHLLIGGVLFGLVRSIARALDIPPERAAKVALLTAAFWLLHPLWVSTTLYAVQRMTQLSALFVLLGLWLYLHTRLKHLPEISPGLVAGTALGISGCGLLAVLSKENAILLPLFVIVLEATVLAAHDEKHVRKATPAFRIYRGALLGLPLLVISAYMASALGPLLAGTAGVREFTPGQRLLTEGRILWDYVFNIVVPRPWTGGLFHDDIRISTGLFSPWQTGLAWMAWGAVIFMAIRVRRRYPALALAVLFFLAGHLIESTWLQLELYFEHRNYLPAALLGLPLALWLTQKSSINRRLLAGLAIMVLAGLTFLRADLWGSPFQQALKWAHTNPESPRAQHYLSNFWEQTGHLEEARRLNMRAIELSPTGLPWLIEDISLTCSRGESPAGALQRAGDALAQNQYPASIATTQVAKLLDYLVAGGCAQIDLETSRAWIERIATIPWISQSPSFAAMLKQREASIELQQGNPQAAFDAFRIAQALSPDEGVHLRNVAMLASQGYIEDALQLLASPPAPKEATGLSIGRLRAWYLARIGYYAAERAYLRQTLLNEQRGASHGPQNVQSP